MSNFHRLGSFNIPLQQILPISQFQDAVYGRHANYSQTPDLGHIALVPPFLPCDVVK